jgi:hypothetical protein
MSRTGWKRREREAAKMIGGIRHPANSGYDVDCTSLNYCAQIKERKVLGLKKQEELLLHIDRIAAQVNKAGLLMLKRSAGRGRETPWMIVMSAATFRHLNGPLPTDTASFDLPRETP